MMGMMDMIVIRLKEDMIGFVFCELVFGIIGLRRVLYAIVG